jgi:hypothetical protein
MRLSFYWSLLLSDDLKSARRSWDVNWWIAYPHARPFSLCFVLWNMLPPVGYGQCVSVTPGSCWVYRKIFFCYSNNSVATHHACVSQPLTQHRTRVNYRSHRSFLPIPPREKKTGFPFSCHCKNEKKGNARSRSKFGYVGHLLLWLPCSHSFSWHVSKWQALWGRLIRVENDFLVIRLSYFSKFTIKVLFGWTSFLPFFKKKQKLKSEGLLLQLVVWLTYKHHRNSMYWSDTSMFVIRHVWCVCTSHWTSTTPKI